MTAKKILFNSAARKQIAHGLNALANALSSDYEGLVPTGVIDPTKVVRVALQNAASVAVLMPTTEALIAERPEDSAAGPEMHDAMSGMGM